MNDHEAALKILRPLADHPFVEAWYQEQASRDWCDFPALTAGPNYMALSDGERALIAIARAVYQWTAVMFTDLGHMQRSWQHHVLACLAARLGLTHAARTTEPGLAWVQVNED